MSGNYSGVNEHSQVRHRKLPKLGIQELTNSRVSSCHRVSLQLSFNLVVLRVLCCGASVLSPLNYLDHPTLTREVVWLFPSSLIQQFPCPNPSSFAWPASSIRSKSVLERAFGPRPTSIFSRFGSLARVRDDLCVSLPQPRGLQVRSSLLCLPCSLTLRVWTTKHYLIETLLPSPSLLILGFILHYYSLQKHPLFEGIGSFVQTSPFPQLCRPSINLQLHPILRRSLSENQCLLTDPIYSK